MNIKNILKTKWFLLSAVTTCLILGYLFGRSMKSEAPEVMKKEMSAKKVVYTCSMHPQIRLNEPGNCPICGMTLIPLEEEGGDTMMDHNHEHDQGMEHEHDQGMEHEHDQGMEHEHDHSMMENNGQEVYYTCTMHPQIHQHDPGKCPICSMTLVRVTTEGGNVKNSIRMSPTAMKLAEIQTAVTAENRAIKNIRINGKIQVDERRRYVQTTHISGRVEQLNVDFTGKYVAKNQVIAYIYSPELVTAQKELLEMYQIRGEYPALFEASKLKLKNWKITDSQIEKILNNKHINEDFPILANYSGYVTRRLVTLGEHVSIGQPLFEVADFSKLWALFDVYESDMQWIKKGIKVSFTALSLPGKVITGEITYVDPVIDPMMRVAKARVEVDNKDLLLRPEMLVVGNLEATLGSDKAIIIPKSAVLWTGKQSIVYIKTKDDKGVYFNIRKIVLGTSLGSAYVVKTGLNIGEEIAVNGAFSIDAAAQLAGKPSMMKQNITNSDEAKHGMMNMPGM